MNAPKIDPEFPDRPQHPDFWALSEAVCSVDKYAGTGKTVADVLDDAHFDADSLIYMARQRARRMLAHAKGGDVANEQMVASLAAVWIDGCLAGLKVGDERSTIAVDQVIDASVENGNRRQGRDG